MTPELALPDPDAAWAFAGLLGVRRRRQYGRVPVVYQGLLLVFLEQRVALRDLRRLMHARLDSLDRCREVHWSGGRYFADVGGRCHHRNGMAVSLLGGYVSPDARGRRARTLSRALDLVAWVKGRPAYLEWVGPDPYAPHEWLEVSLPEDHYAL